jgi:thioredoxin reductase (NADPH)
LTKNRNPNIVYSVAIDAGETLDVIIIGGGPAGLSAALWCAELGLKAALFERSKEFGGQLMRVYNPITNYIGVKARNGRELRDRFLDHSVHATYERVTKADVEYVDCEKKVVMLADGREVSAKAIVIATGVRRRKLNIPGEQQFQGKGILESGVAEKETVAGKRVVIVGGGDAAIENALLLSEVAAGVAVAHRSRVLRARPQFAESVHRRGNVLLFPGTELTRILGDSVINAVELKNISDGSTWIEPVDALLIRVGVQPNSELVRGAVDLDEAGYIKVNAFCETNIADIFAVGDVANPLSPTISSAAGSGAAAVKAIFHSLGA